MSISDRAHSLFSPSRLAMLSSCPSWVSKPSIAGDRSSDAERGTNYHEAIIAGFLKGASGHEDLTINYALRQLAGIRQDFPYLTWETEAALDSGIPHVMGWGDIIGTDSFESTGCVIEIKTGFNERPEARHNLQLKAYSLSLLKEFEVVHGYIIEGDLKKTTAHTWTRQDMEAITNEILFVIELALEGKERFPGRHCDYCRQSLVCPAVEKAVITVQQAQHAIGEVETLTPAEVSEKLFTYWDAMELCEKYWNGLKARAIAIIEAGGKVEGFNVKTSAGARRWIDEASAIDALSRSGIDIKQLMVLPSPSQVEQVLKASGLKATEAKALLSKLTAASERKQLVKIPGPSEKQGIVASIACKT